MNGSAGNLERSSILCPSGGHTRALSLVCHSGQHEANHGGGGGEGRGRGRGGPRDDVGERHLGSWDYRCPDPITHFMLCECVEIIVFFFSLSSCVL